MESCDKEKSMEDVCNLKKEIEKLTNDVIKATENWKRDQENCNILETTVARLEKEKADKERKISEQQNIIFNLTKHICELTKELDVLKTKSKLQVQLMSKYDSELMRAAVEELATAIKKSSSDIELDVIRCMKGSDIQHDIPLILMCFGTSTIRQEVEKTLKGLSVTKQTAVVIVHLKVEHALPVHPSDRILTNKEFESLGGIYDIGFMPETGLYKCQFNDANLTSIMNFINRVGPVEKNRKLKNKE